MTCYTIKLLLFSLLSQVGTKGEDRLRLGLSDSLATNATFSEQVDNMGLYSLGQVERNGYLISACVNGKINKFGILPFYIIRESNGIWKVHYSFDMTFNKPGQKCRSIFDNSLAPQQNDFIAVFVGSNITLMKGNKEYQPIQIAFEKKGADDSMFKYFDGSNSFNDKKYNLDVFNQRVQRIIQGQHPHERLSPSRYRLNVQVTIHLDPRKRNSVLLVLVVVSVCIILALFTVILLLMVKLYKRRAQSTERAIGLTQIPSIDRCGNDTEDSTLTPKKDFSDVHYLLQKDTKPAVININHFHSSKTQKTSTRLPKDKHTYSLLTNPEEELQCDSTEATTFQDHDYDEPYFEPACTEETLIKQLKSLGVPQIAKETLRLCTEDVLGRGAFGSVHRGVLYSVLEFNKLTEEEVAVKTLEDTTSVEDRVKFLQEAAIMGQFSHPNIIKILGIVISPDSCKLVIEVMSHGDLRNHLHTIKLGDLEQELAPTLLGYSRHVANGMMYLAVKSFVHRDLAARNVLVAEDGVCKIADFGLSRKIQDEDYYVSHGGKIPVKWTAPEALHYHKYSTASDVWSYGCVLYEIWSLGEKPYHDLTNEQTIEKLSSGFRLSPPPGCPREVYQLMIQCWHSDPVQRPSFMDITAQLQKPDYQVLKWKEDSQVSGDTSSSSKEARVIGAALEAGFQLHQDLQKTYQLP